jgi:hypothetical protein
VTVTDPLPAGLAYVSNDCGAVFASPTLTWSFPSLAVSASDTCSLVATVVQPGLITNTAIAAGNEPDPIPGNNTGSATFTALQSVVEVPTLDRAGVLLLLAGLALAAVWVLRRAG